jgi:hypothetical protein
MLKARTVDATHQSTFFVDTGMYCLVEELEADVSQAAEATMMASSEVDVEHTTSLLPFHFVVLTDINLDVICYLLRNRQPKQGAPTTSRESTGYPT